MGLQNDKVEALEEGGFVFNKKANQWVGHDVSLNHKTLADLSLWELDQVIEAARRGDSIVRLGGNGQHELRLR